MNATVATASTVVVVLAMWACAVLWSVSDLNWVIGLWGVLVLTALLCVVWLTAPRRRTHDARPATDGVAQ